LEYQWPASRTIEVDWRQENRSGRREDRLVRRIQTSVPAEIRDEQPFFSAQLAAKAERACLLAAALDATADTQLGSLASLLLRAESAASSKIEGLAASPSDFARAAYGSKGNSTAIEMIDGGKALQWLLGQVKPNDELKLDQILHAHKMLFASDSSTYVQAGNCALFKTGFKAATSHLWAPLTFRHRQNSCRA